MGTDSERQLIDQLRVCRCQLLHEIGYKIAELEREFYWESRVLAELKKWLAYEVE
jgi:hypothetical protein